MMNSSFSEKAIAITERFIFPVLLFGAAFYWLGAFAECGYIPRSGRIESQINAFALLIPATVFLVRRKNPFPKDALPFLFPVILFVGLVTLSSIIALFQQKIEFSDLTAGTKIPVTVCLISFLLIRSSQTAIKIAVAGAGILALSACIYEYFIYEGTTFRFLFSTNPNTRGISLMFLAVFMLYFSFTASRDKEGYIWILGFFTLEALIVLTGSRGAFLAIAAFLSVVSIFKIKQLSTWLHLILFIGVFLMTTTYSSGIIISKTITEFEYDNDKPLRIEFSSRENIHRASWELIKASDFWTGLGIENFKKNSPWRDHEVIHHPHNMFLNFWVNLGMLGLFAITALLVGLSCWSLHQTRLLRINGKTNPASTFMFAVLIGFTARNMFDASFIGAGRVQPEMLFFTLCFFFFENRKATNIPQSVCANVSNEKKIAKLSSIVIS